MKKETPAETLQRIESSGFSRNEVIAMQHFTACGIPADSVDPKHNVLTYEGWKAKGRQVAKGATGCQIGIVHTDDDGRKRFRRGRVFHVSQTVERGLPKGTKPQAWNNPKLVKAGTYEAESRPQPQPQTTFDRMLAKYNEAKRAGVGIESLCTCPMAGVVTNVDCPQHGIHD